MLGGEGEESTNFWFHEISVVFIGRVLFLLDRPISDMFSRSRNNSIRRLLGMGKVLYI